MRDPHTKESRGFAFVMMETGEEADACIANLNATELLGRTINVEKARRGRARTPTPGQYHGPPKRCESLFLSAIAPSVSRMGRCLLSTLNG
jgi:RNA recognition motif-containing protein